MPGKMAFIRIDQIVRLNDDLIVDAINLIDRMMMTYEKRDPIGIGNSRNRKTRSEAAAGYKGDKAVRE